MSILAKRLLFQVAAAPPPPVSNIQLVGAATSVLTPQGSPSIDISGLGVQAGDVGIVLHTSAEYVYSTYSPTPPVATFDGFTHDIPTSSPSSLEFALIGMSKIMDGTETIIGHNTVTYKYSTISTFVAFRNATIVASSGASGVLPPTQAGDWVVGVVSSSDRLSNPSPAQDFAVPAGYTEINITDNLGNPFRDMKMTTFYKENAIDNEPTPIINADPSDSTGVGYYVLRSV